MFRRTIRSLALASFLFLLGRGLSPAAPDYSKEAAVIDSLATNLSFTADGARQFRQTTSVRIQSEAAVRQYGILSFFYDASTEKVTIDYVRVLKPDGSVVETPASSVIDLATEVAAVAPTFSDLRQKQIPVKALAVGDKLEYSVRSSEQTPEFPGQFWYSQYFVSNSVVLNQTIEVRVPKEKYVQVSSPKVRTEIHEVGDQRVYLWKYAHLDPSTPEDQKKSTSDADLPKMQLTTFRSWEEVGNWWAALASGQTDVTPAIEAKAKELTAGLHSDAEKERAIYQYVSLRFRYISLSLGAGRYRPHTAAEVLSNAYGDCKDKHTLLAALLKVAGIEAWPALVGAGLKFDPNLPSPAQFNHVVTVLPQNGTYLWLDSTPEVAPFGFLSQAVRDEQALVIPASGPQRKPILVKTPIDPLAPANENLNVKASLSPEGTLTGHFDFALAADDALGMRSGFRQLAPAQWQALTQQFAYALNFGGDVSTVAIENLEDLEKPFHISYDYTRKDYSDWREHKIIAPFPPIGFGPGDTADQPKDPFWAGSPGVASYRAAIALPKGFSVELPQDTHLTTDFAEYSAHYLLENGTVLIAERKMTIKKAKVTPDQWEAYQKFNKGLRDEQANLLQLYEKGDKQATATTFEHAGSLPESYGPQLLRVNYLLRTGQRQQGMIEARQITAATSDASVLDYLARLLDDTDCEFDWAQQLAQKAVDQLEQAASRANLAAVENGDLQEVNKLAVAWDTLGWTYFKRSKTAQARSYLAAAWQLSQISVVADHLGVVYDREGKHRDALHMWWLALAVDKKDDEARLQLQKAGVSASAFPIPPQAQPFLSPDEELGHLRTFGVPALRESEGSAEYFLLLSSKGIEDARLISGDSGGFEKARSAILAANPGFAFPDSGPEKIVRRGILFCSKYTTPNCNFTLLPAVNAKVSPARNSRPASTAPTSASVNP